MKHIIIATTSLNRTLLHNETIPGWRDWITESKDYHYTWFINIDLIKELNETYEFVQENYQLMLQDKVNKIIFLNEPNNKGNFLQACKRLVVSINDYINNLVQKNPNINLVNDVVLVWIEDDWKINNPYTPFNNLLNTFLSVSSMINLTFIRNNYIWALAPSIISYNLFKKLFYEGWTKNQNTTVDPEHCLGLYYLKEILNSGKSTNKKVEHIKNLTIINKKIDSKFILKFVDSSHYTYLNNKFNIGTENNFIPMDKCKDYFGLEDVFIRLCPKYCTDDGCQLGRSFMEKYSLKKAFDNNEMYEKKS
jgi:hypothetical protein